jgi:hypothetical protein
MIKFFYINDFTIKIYSKSIYFKEMIKIFIIITLISSLFRIDSIFLADDQ